MAKHDAGTSITLFLILMCIVTHVNSEDAKKQPKENIQQNLQQAKPKELRKSQHIQHIPSPKEVMQQKKLQQSMTTQEPENLDLPTQKQPRKPRADKLTLLAQQRFECESVGFYANPYNCSIFHLCIEKQEISSKSQNQSSDYITITFQCNAGFLYNPESNSCINSTESSRAIECSSQSSRQPENDFKFGKENERNDVSSSPQPPQVEYVIDNGNDGNESENGLNDDTTPFIISLSDKPVQNAGKQHPSNTTPKRTPKTGSKSSTSTLSPTSDEDVFPTTYKPGYGRSATPRNAGNPRESQSQRGNTELQKNVPETAPSLNNQSPIIYILPPPQLSSTTVGDSKNEQSNTDSQLQPDQPSVSSVEVPKGRRPVVYVVRRKKPAQNDSHDEQEPRQEFHNHQVKSTAPPPSLQSFRSTNKNKGEQSNKNGFGPRKPNVRQPTSSTPEEESTTEQQQLPYDGNSGSTTQAPVIYIIPPPGSLQNSNLLLPQSNKSSPKPQTLVDDDKSSGNRGKNGVPISNEYPKGKFGDENENADGNNQDSQIHLPGPSDALPEPSINLLPPWPETPEEFTDVSKVENNDELSTEPNQIWQTEKNKPKSKFTSSRPQFPSPTTPKTVRNTSHRTYASTTKRSPSAYSTTDQTYSTEANRRFDSQDDLHSRGSFDSSDSFYPEPAQPQPDYNNRPASPRLVPPQQPTYPLTNAQSYPPKYPQPKHPVPRFGYPSYNADGSSFASSSSSYGNSDNAANSGVTGPQYVWVVPESSSDNIYSNNKNVDPTGVQQGTNNDGFVYPEAGTNNEGSNINFNNYETPPPSPSYQWNQFSSSVAPSTNYYGEGQQSVQTQPGQSFGAGTSHTKKQSRNQQAGEAVCSLEGFYPIENDCKHFYRCVGAGHSFIKYTFSCGPGTVWDPNIDACNHLWATHRQDC